jgi:hypothetical protein
MLTGAIFLYYLNLVPNTPLSGVQPHPVRALMSDKLAPPRKKKVHFPLEETEDITICLGCVQLVSNLTGVKSLLDGKVYHRDCLLLGNCPTCKNDVFKNRDPVKKADGFYHLNCARWAGSDCRESVRNLGLCGSCKEPVMSDQESTRDSKKTYYHRTDECMSRGPCGTCGILVTIHDSRSRVNDVYSHLNCPIGKS